jgi:hypothetical protein
MKNDDSPMLKRRKERWAQEDGTSNTSTGGYWKIKPLGTPPWVRNLKEFPYDLNNARIVYHQGWVPGEICHIIIETKGNAEIVARDAKIANSMIQEAIQKVPEFPNLCITKIVPGINMSLSNPFQVDGCSLWPMLVSDGKIQCTGLKLIIMQCYSGNRSVKASIQYELDGSIRNVEIWSTTGFTGGFSDTYTANARLEHGRLTVNRIAKTLTDGSIPTLYTHGRKRVFPCPKCGSPTNLENLFCKKCGTRL